MIFKDPINGEYIIPIGFEHEGNAIKLSSKPQNRLLKVQAKYVEQLLFLIWRTDTSDFLLDFRHSLIPSDEVAAWVIYNVVPGFIGLVPSSFRRQSGLVRATNIRLDEKYHVLHTNDGPMVRF